MNAMYYKMHCNIKKPKLENRLKYYRPWHTINVNIVKYSIEMNCLMRKCGILHKPQSGKSGHHICFLYFHPG